MIQLTKGVLIIYKVARGNPILKQTRLGLRPHSPPHHYPWKFYKKLTIILINIFLMYKINEPVVMCYKTMYIGGL